MGLAGYKISTEKLIAFCTLAMNNPKMKLGKSLY
jgi:hypothetical protein